MDGLKEIRESFPEGCVKATLISEGSHKVFLDNSFGSWGNKEKVLRLSSSNGVPTKLEFKRIELSSCKEIKNAMVKWYNFSE